MVDKSARQDSAEELARKAHASADNYALFPSLTSKAMVHSDIDSALAAARREALLLALDTINTALAEVREYDASWLRAFDDNETKPEKPQFYGKDLHARTDHTLDEVRFLVVGRLRALADKPAKEVGK